MKKSLFVLLSLALCLSACTPAASSVPAPTPTSETPVESAPAEETAAVVGNLQSIMQRRNTGKACYSYQAMQGEIQKLDYADASVETLYRFGEPGTVYSDVIVEPDALYAVTADTLYKVPLDGGEATTQPLQNLPGSRTPAWCDERGPISSRAIPSIRRNRTWPAALTWKPAPSPTCRCPISCWTGCLRRTAAACCCGAV